MRLIDADAMLQNENEAYNKSLVKTEGTELALPNLIAHLKISKLIEETPTETALENKPLTLKQLREMKGQPVYCIGQTRFDVHFDGWKVVTKNNSMVNVIRFTDGTDFPVDVYGKRLLAYARRPEGSETNG